VAGAAALFVLGAAAPVGADVRAFRPWHEATPPLALKDLQGQVHTLAAYRGRVVLVNFWATWCGPCREEMPSLHRLQERLGDAPFTVLAVNHGESAARIGAFLEGLGVRFTVLRDPNQEAARAWRVRVLPVTFLLDPEGRVRHHVVGEVDWAADEVVALVRSLAR
jgi:thiol-disulfide isomerase/thioredoxin